MAELKWGAGTHPGQIRAQNEDNLHVADGVFVVADGMGGHEAGEVASHIAVERIRQALETDGHLTAEQVVASITEANGDIFRAAIANPGQAGMGTTVTAIAVIEDPMAGRGAPNIDDNDPIDTDPDGNPRVTPVVPLEQPEALVLANVGDSRTYLFRHDRLRRVTVDHSYVQELVATGHITDDEARYHPRRNIITRALGIEPDVKVDWWTLPLIRGDRFVLCSDGLVDEVTDDEITETLRSHPDPQEAADRLIHLANAAGGRDNITVVVVDVLDGDDPPDPTQEIDLVPQWADDTVPTPFPPPVVGEPATLAELGGGEDADDATPGKRRRRRDRRANAAKQAAEAAAALEALSHPSDDDADGNTTGDESGESSDAKPGKARRPRLGRAIAIFVVVAALLAATVVLGAWARRGYYVDFDDDGDVTVFQGRRGGVLWIDPTVESGGPSRDDLDDASIDLVDEHPTFSSRTDAEAFVAGLDLADETHETDADALTDDDVDPDVTDESDTDETPATTEG
ncbi:SpoIIE family protein phosphatase [Ilumatobacter coccineus]|uniref:Putative serine/threonine protein phosphatase n=1 Tax=Ilumatobacter coccineus (strain NBRC 103263 / KCTC 29153 / YM16-304) TaxID=1313172 RepID=A0A6C7E5E0_ILUCY|nr:PP2C family serine/threonine-protein phosphatase [Ilumatobacter coccineus]BAN00529.1 putative serine/threonine protein phosphatase [Ilumatobacter coccineus YM16-304]